MQIDQGKGCFRYRRDKRQHSKQTQARPLELSFIQVNNPLKRVR